MVSDVTLSPENEAFRRKIYAAVARIPPGRVTSYGELARALGRPRNARLVGQILYGVPEELDLPCHRVVGSDGSLKAGWLFGHPEVMKRLLLEEDVPFRGEYRVDIERCFWSPAADEVNDLDRVPIVEDDLAEG